MKILRKILLFLIPLAGFYILCDIINIAWLITRPEGYWSFTLFIGVLGSIVFGIVISVCLLIFIYSGVVSFIKDFSSKQGFKSLLKGFGILLALMFLFAMDFLQGSGLSLYLNNFMANKYSYINQTEKLISSGNFEKAYYEAQKAYQKEKKIDKSSIFPLSYLYKKSSYFRRVNFQNQYAATINLASCLERKQKLKESEKLYCEAINISRRISLEDRTVDGYEIFPLASLAQLKLYNGDYFSAEQLFSELELLVTNGNDEDFNYTITALNVFAEYNDRVGDFSRSALIRRRIVKLFEKQYEEPVSAEYFGMLLLSISSELKIGNMIAAGKVLTKAITLSEKKKKNELYLHFLKLKGVYCSMAFQRNQGSEEVLTTPWYRKLPGLEYSISIRERFLKEAGDAFSQLNEEEKDRHGKYNVNYAESLSWLAFYRSVNGEISEAQKLYSDALTIFRSLGNSTEDFYYKTLINSVLLKTAINEKDFFNITNAEKQILNNIERRLLFLNEYERETYTSKTETTLRAIQSIYIRQNTSASISQLYDNALALKNIALSHTYNLRQNILRQDGKLKKEFLNLLRDKELLESRGQLLTEKEYEKKQFMIRREERNIYKQIALDSSLKYSSPNLHWTEVKESLKVEEVAIEFINVPQEVGHNSSVDYYALVLKKGFNSPKLVKVCGENELQEILFSGNSTNEKIENNYTVKNARLYELIWKPMEVYLAGISTVYISRSGLLHNVSFSAMSLDKGYDVRLIGSTRNIVLKRPISKDKKAIALFGDIAFDNKINFPSLAFGSKTAKTRRLNHWRQLPYTKWEVETIKSIFSTSNLKAELFSGAVGSESQVRTVVRNGFNILHFATHGVYNAAKESSRLDLHLNFGLDNNNLSATQIVLAGANNRNEDANNDGYLNGLEISRLNLSEIDLVVLSACESGIGKIGGTEGSYGLHRAFSLAGARAVMVSLWKVPDRQTALLMALFYKNYVQGYTKSESLRIAQLEIRKKYPSPYYWGGFTLVEEL